METRLSQIRSNVIKFNVKTKTKWTLTFGWLLFVEPQNKAFKQVKHTRKSKLNKFQSQDSSSHIIITSLYWGGNTTVDT